jgi:hypothetical protein
MNKFELKNKLNTWLTEANEQLREFQLLRNQLDYDLLGLNVKIGEVAGTFYVRGLTPEGVEEVREGLGDNFDLDKMLCIPSYGPMNVFVALRIYGRKRNALKRKFHEASKPINTLRDELKEMCKMAKEFSKTDHSDMVSNLIFSTTDYWDRFKEITEKPLAGSDADFMMQIEGVFRTVPFIKRDDLLQVITLNKELNYWDGSHVKPFSEQYAEMPENIDFEAFKDLIFIEKIEHDKDSYLMDIFMNHMFSVMNQYKAETGEDMIDSFALLEDITGKPLQTYTADFDEYGDVVNVTPNKLNLKVVDTAHE